MATKILMPKLSDTMSDGVIVEWKKNEGDTIASGDIIAEVETDKATMELENFEEGTLLKILISKGGKIPVGGAIAIVGEKGENIDELLKEIETLQKPAPAEPEKKEEPPRAAPKEPTPPPPPVEPKAPPAPTPKPVAERLGRVKASPLARRMADSKKVDIASILGSGPGGRIVKKDVEAALSSDKSGQSLASAIAGQFPPLEQKDIPLTQIRKAIADRLTESKTTIPHFYVTVEVDMQRAIELRGALKEEAVGSVSYNDMVIRACALCLRRYPEVNASFMGEFIRQHGEIHIGMAVAIPDGLIVPVIRNADQKSLLEISSESKELVMRAKDRKLKPDEFTGSTFTTSNMGMFNVEEFSAIINPPEAAILAISSILEKAVAVKGEIRARKRMRLTISSDHRVIDGTTAARFMKQLKRLLENPMLL